MYVDRSRTYIGVVEDNEDPKKLGRVRARVLDLFDDMPIDDIPWASPWKDLNGNEFNVPEKGKVGTHLKLILMIILIELKISNKAQLMLMDGVKLSGV